MEGVGSIFSLKGPLVSLCTLSVSEKKLNQNAYQRIKRFYFAIFFSSMEYPYQTTDIGTYWWALIKLSMLLLHSTPL